MSSNSHFQQVASLSLTRGDIPLWQIGSGASVLFILPGYRQSAEIWQKWLPEKCEGWTLVLLGMPGAIGEVEERDKAWTQTDWLELLGQLRERYRPKKEAWLGYSLGGRLLLHLAGLAQSGIGRVLLMSPDGLDPSISERLFLYHKTGRKPLQWLISHPGKAKVWADRLHKLRIMSDSGHYFALRQLRDEHSLKSGFHAVRIYTGAQPRARALRRADVSRNMTVWVSWGESDRVRPIAQSRKLWKFFRRIYLVAVPGGHTWPQSSPELFHDWIKQALEEDFA